ncbi:hypothetical protein [Arsenicibacter rosenii]|uniref:Uncharacterized protein n=1 Tax=Arsenicibacter rosenii TaxID=1750698 RepID=A0A1S2VR02_9BACT|nr:hypothetical protein [Arsenicibacter rosenii]OIN61217.1 hypothetical protein BLX24_03915 [Arsenicibacter rosenii]
MEFWLYAEDGTGTKKGMYWFVPTGNYQFSAWANKPDGSGQYPATAGYLTVASGKVYPHIKLAFQ